MPASPARRTRDDDLRLVLRLGGIAALGGAALGAIDPAHVRSETAAWIADAVVGGVGLAALGSGWTRPSRSVLLVALLLSSAAIAQAEVNLVDRPGNGYALFSVLIAAGAALVLGPRALAAVLATIVVGAVPALVLGRVPAVEWALAAGAPIFVGVLLFRQARLVRASLRRVHELADADPLTGVANRRAFHQRLVAEMARGRRHATPVSILYLDLDLLKHVNDAFGHAAGDEALCRAAAAIADELRGMDHLGRMGGDEFAVLLPGTDAAGARTLAGRIVEAVRKAEVRGQRLGVSAGAATFPVDATTPDGLLDRADARLLQVKRERFPVPRRRPRTPGRRPHPRR